MIEVSKKLLKLAKLLIVAENEIPKSESPVEKDSLNDLLGEEGSPPSSEEPSAPGGTENEGVGTSPVESVKKDPIEMSNEEIESEIEEEAGKEFKDYLKNEMDELKSTYSRFAEFYDKLEGGDTLEYAASQILYRIARAVIKKQEYWQDEILDLL